MNSKNIIVRALTGALYVAAVTACVLIDSWTLLGLCLVLCVAAQTEWLGLSRAGHGRLTLPGAAIMLLDLTAGAAMVWFVWDWMGMIPSFSDTLYSHELIAWELPQLTMAFLLQALFFMLVGALYVLARVSMQIWMKEGPDAVSSLGASFMAQAWIALPLAMLPVIWSLSGKWMLMALFIFLWLNDTGAYLTGVTLGRHRMFERISPKKSWEGFAGGALLAIGGAFVMWGCFPATWGHYGLGKMAAVAGTTVVAGTLGDLAESLVKRTLGVKDSSHVLPGHGGILDRIDSLLLASLAVTLLTLYW